MFRSNVPRSVYEPIRYVFQTGGKRVRSVLTLLSCEAVGGKARNALGAAVAIEILHNFTLVHDDVMDNAELRRGCPTVHRRWDTNVAILSGDQMIPSAYRLLLTNSLPRKERALEVFTDAFKQVCEGQGLDKEFELRSDVTLRDYFVMIRKKTGRVITAATEIGALAGGGSQEQVTTLRKFGECLGRAFQLQDDLLDIVGSEPEFGKTIGGDIIEGKKTYLLLRAIELSAGTDRSLLRSIAQHKKVPRNAVKRVKSIYERTGVLRETEREIARSTKQAQQMLGDLPMSSARETLHWLAHRLLVRHS
jgi:geranylgeranyl diphosphate synthase, type II